jgi:hypothetical protein
MSISLRSCLRRRLKVGEDGTGKAPLQVVDLLVGDEIVEKDLSH